MGRDIFIIHYYMDSNYIYHKFRVYQYRANRMIKHIIARLKARPSYAFAHSFKLNVNLLLKYHKRINRLKKRTVHSI